MTPQTPYYQQEGITLWHGDANDLLPRCHADVTITDPPYNVGMSYDEHNDHMPRETYQVWLADILKQCPGENVVYFPGVVNAFDVPTVLRMTDLRPYRQLGWHKREFAGDRWTSGPPLSWEPIIWATRVMHPPFQTIFGEAGRDFLVVNAIHGDPFKGPHPCPKPLKVMRWLVGLLSAPRDIICDPFCGTGTLLQAARDMGRQAIGIERSAAYCALTVERLQQGTSARRAPAQDVFDWTTSP